MLTIEIKYLYRNIGAGRYTSGTELVDIESDSTPLERVQQINHWWISTFNNNKNIVEIYIVSSQDYEKKDLVKK